GAGGAGDGAEFGGDAKRGDAEIGDGRDGADENAGDGRGPADYEETIEGAAQGERRGGLGCAGASPEQGEDGKARQQRQRQQQATIIAQVVGEPEDEGIAGHGQEQRVPGEEADAEADE